MNTRRYPRRTLAEAFKGADYAGAITTPRNHVIGYHGAMKPKNVIPLKPSVWVRLWRAIWRKA
jgi:hypothetical protein